MKRVLASLEANYRPSKRTRTGQGRGNKRRNVVTYMVVACALQRKSLTRPFRQPGFCKPNYLPLIPERMNLPIIVSSSVSKKLGGLSLENRGRSRESCGLSLSARLPVLPRAREGAVAQADSVQRTRHGRRES